MPFHRSSRNFRGRRKQRHARIYRPIRFIRRMPLTQLKFPNPIPFDYNFVVDPLFVGEEDYLQYEFDEINTQTVKNDFFDDNDTHGHKKLHRTGSLPSLDVLNEMIEMYEKKYESGYIDCRNDSPLYHFPSKDNPTFLSKIEKKKVKRCHSIVDLRYYFVMTPESIETVASLREFESACKMEKVLYILNFCNFRQLITKAQQLGYLTPNIIRYLSNNNIYEILNVQEVVANKIGKFNWILYYNIHKKNNQLFNNINKKSQDNNDLDDENQSTSDGDEECEDDEEEIEDMSDEDVFDYENEDNNSIEIDNYYKKEHFCNGEVNKNNVIDGEVIEKIGDRRNDDKVKNSNLNNDGSNTSSSTNLPSNKVQEYEPVFFDDNSYQKTEVLNGIVENNNIDKQEKINSDILYDKKDTSFMANQKMKIMEESPKSIHVINNLEEAIEIINKSKKIVVLNGYQTIANSKVPHWKVNRDLLRKIINKYNLNSYKDIFDIECYKRNPFPLHEYANSFEHWSYEISNSLNFIKLLSDSGRLLRCYSENIDGMEYLAGVPVHQFCAVNGSIACSICRICRRHYPWNSAPIANVGIGLNLKYCEWCLAVVVPCISFEKDIKSITSKYCTLEYDALNADLLLILGTSLDVSPFNLLPKLFPLIPKIMIAKSFNPNTSFIPDFVCLGDPDTIVKIIDGSNTIPNTIDEQVIARRIKTKPKSKINKLLYSNQKLNFLYEKNWFRNPAKTIALGLCHNVGAYLTSKEKIYIHERFCLFNTGEAYYLKNLPFKYKFIISPMQLRSIIPDKVYREVIRENFLCSSIISLLNSKRCKTYERIIEDTNQLMVVIRNVLEYIQHIKLTHQG
uniref:Deacetylase sirtuin-type domain-containing protein n=1 Tax=Strongyloides papillosus TaxID=174720 RepID=A0A0N5BH33_STREA